MAFLTGDRLSQLLDAQIAERSKEVEDAVSYNSPAFDMLRGKFKSGTGRRWEIPVEVYESPAPEEVTNEDAEFTVQKIGDITEVAAYEWQTIDVSQVTVPWTMSQQNTGKEQVFDLVQLHTESVKRACAKSMASRVFATGNHLSIRDLCDADIAVIGEIDATTTPNWSPTTLDFTDDGTGNPFPSVEVAIEDFGIERAAFSTGGKGMWVTGRNGWKHLRNEIRERTHLDMLGSDGKTPVGFSSIYVDGVQVAYDPFVDPTEMLWIEEPALELRYLGDNMIKTHEAISLPGADNTKVNLTKVIPIVSVCSVGTRNRRSLGMLKNIPPVTYS